MNVTKYIGLIMAAGLLISACAPSLTQTNNPPKETMSMQPQKTTTTVSPQSTSQQQLTEATTLPADKLPFGAAGEFSTDFSKHTVSSSEIFSGGPPKDGIPAIDKPAFVNVEEANEWLKPVEPVILVEVGEAARAYPLQILMWHEIVNDTVDELPLAITFCPLCNTAIVFLRSFDGQVLDFGTTGRLRYSNLIMYDRQTETWWQQGSGEAIAGKYAGERLGFYPAIIGSWQDFKSAHPDGLVLSRDTGYDRAYGNNPYTGYDDVNQPPFLYNGPATPGVLPPMTRVLTVDLPEGAVAYPYDVLQDVLVVNDTIGNQPVAVFWAAGTASALDSGTVASGRDVGSAAAYSRMVDGLEVQFFVEAGVIKDEQTGSEWNVLGRAVAGELAGTQLTPVVAINHFWFSWAAFKPETRVYQP